jgi:hypothetical protein
MTNQTSKITITHHRLAPWSPSQVQQAELPPPPPPPGQLSARAAYSQLGLVPSSLPPLSSNRNNSNNSNDTNDDENTPVGVVTSLPPIGTGGASLGGQRMGGEGRGDPLGGKRAYVFNLCVTPLARRRGVASVLVSQIVVRAREVRSGFQSNQKVPTDCLSDNKFSRNHPKMRGK